MLTSIVRFFWNIIRKIRNIPVRFDSLLRRKFDRTHLESFISSHRTNDLVLDLGCGNARYSQYFPNRIGLDIFTGTGVHIVADAHHLPLKSSTFPVVVTTEMLEHVQYPQGVVDEIERVLKPEGKVILSTRFVFPIHEAPFDFYRFSKYGLSYLFRNWEHVEIKNDTSPFEGIGLLFQRMAFQSDFYGSKIVSILCLFVAQILRVCDRLIKTQYGDFRRSIEETEIITSGYHVVATKVSK